MPDDQTSSSRVYNLNRCGQHRFAEVSVVLVIDVHRGFPVEGRRELSLLQEQAGVRVEEEPLATILAGPSSIELLLPFLTIVLAFLSSRSDIRVLPPSSNNSADFSLAGPLPSKLSTRNEIDCVFMPLIDLRYRARISCAPGGDEVCRRPPPVLGVGDLAAFWLDVPSVTGVAGNHNLATKLVLVDSVHHAHHLPCLQLVRIAFVRLNFELWQ